jgi:hypothetical protein
MTTDDLVRDALTDLAPIAPADDTAFAGVRRAVARRRRRRAAGRVAAALLAVGLIAGGGVVIGGVRRDGESRVATRPPTTGDTRQVTFAGMSLDLPEGWEVISRDVSEDRMCIGPAGNPYPRFHECSGLELHHGDPLPGNELDEYQDHGPWGWYPDTDVNPCPNQPYDPGQQLDGIQSTGAGYDPVETDEVEVGGRPAAYDRWAARCERSGYTFSPRAWHLDDEQILIVDVVGRDEVDAIIESIRWRN